MTYLIDLVKLYEVSTKDELYEERFFKLSVLLQIAQAERLEVIAKILEQMLKDKR